MSNPTFIWYELITPDPAAAARFYETVVGWRTAPFEGGMDYTILWAGDHGVGGMGPLPGDMRESGLKPGWYGYVGVPDADAAAAGIRSLGGTVLRAPDDIPGVGRYAVAADPTGAAFMLLAPKPMDSPPPAPPARMTPGNVGWHELNAGDGDAAFSFFSRLFGWSQVGAFSMGAHGTYVLWSPDGGEMIGGMMTRMEGTPAPTWVYYFVVEGIDAAAERIAANGGTIVNGPMPVPDGSFIVQAVDAQGAAFALVSATR
jgi:hypothetical protein